MGLAGFNVHVGLSLPSWGFACAQELESRHRDTSGSRRRAYAYGALLWAAST